MTEGRESGGGTGNGTMACAPLARDACMVRPHSPLPRPTPDFAALRLLESPEAVDVECAADGAPRALAWRGQRITVLRAVGPERLSGDWWRDGYRRDYWRCAPEGGAVAGELLLYQDPRGGWHVQGWYD